MWWTTSSGSIELNITKKQAGVGSHSGSCDADISFLRTDPKIRRQLDKLDAKLLSDELAEYGAWDEKELADQQENLDRILWRACGDIVEGLMD